MTLAKMAKMNPIRLGFIKAQTQIRLAKREEMLAKQPSFRWRAKFDFLLQIMAEVAEKRVQRENNWGVLADVA